MRIHCSCDKVIKGATLAALRAAWNTHRAVFHANSKVAA